MPISGTSINYTGRTRDVCVLRGFDTTGRRTVSTLTFGSPSSFCAGIQKLVQRYMVTFLTSAGSQSDYPTFGTDFLSSLTGGTFNPSTLDATHIFNFANAAVTDLFRNYQANNPNDPLDEQLDSAVLTRVAAYGDSVAFDVQLTSRAGVTVTFLIPLPR